MVPYKFQPSQKSEKLDAGLLGTCANIPSCPDISEIASEAWACAPAAACRIRLDEGLRSYMSGYVLTDRSIGPTSWSEELHRLPRAARTLWTFVMCIFDEISPRVSVQAVES